MRRLQILAFALLLLGASKHQQPSPAGISLSPTSWHVLYSNNVSLQSLSGMAGWWFQFPTLQNSVNYVTTPYTAALSEGQTMSFSAQIVATDGDPDLEPWESCNTSGATVRAYIEQQPPKGCPGAVYTCAPNTARWWGNPLALELAPGTATVSVPVRPDQWSDADGHVGTDDLKGWAEALAHPAAVGMTFGSPCAFGHGAGVVAGTGSARFILTSYTIQ